jgi:SsrA-binding protein
MPAMAKSKGKSNKHAPRITNRRARHDYHIDETIECGIMLVGSEVKAIREGKVSLTGGFARVEPDGQLWLCNVDIGHYGHAPVDRQHATLHRRKLLAHGREIRSLAQQTQAKGSTLVPLAMYFNERGLCKVQIGVARGKTHQDKRSTLKEKDARRAIERGMTRKRLG